MLVFQKLTSRPPQKKTLRPRASPPIHQPKRRMRDANGFGLACMGQAFEPPMRKA